MHENPSVATARPPSEPEPGAWRRSLSRAIRDPDRLIEALDLPESLRDGARRASRRFPLLVPPEYLARIRPGDPDDPLLRQVLPLDAEEASVEGFVPDPVGDEAARRAPGLLRKYHGRALLVASGACAVHCRYCFRRHFAYSEQPGSMSSWEPAIRDLRSDPSVHEVILSGGDPLLLPDSRLEELTHAIAALRHVHRLRVHSRLPIVLPDRVDASLLRWLRSSRLTPWMVVHANHPHELEGAAAEALARLVDAGVPVLNQAVLLRGVNDDIATLTALSERLCDLRVAPYYLHRLDRVAGAAHFEVDTGRGVRLVEELRSRLPGYAIPSFVEERPGAPSKVRLA